VVDFAIDTTGEHTLDARATVQDGQDDRALRTMQAVQEAVLRHSLLNGLYLDQVLWSILDTDRRQAKAVWGPKVH
jgi:hypothetical protein